MRHLLAAGIVLASVWVANSAEFSKKFRIYKSIDKGKSWVSSDQGFAGTDRLNSFARLDNKYFAATDAGIYVSHNGGETWKVCEGELVKDRRITCLEVINSKVFATSSKGIIISLDGGVTWELVKFDFGFNEPRTLYSSEKAIFLGTNSKGVYRSINDGITWEHLSAGLPARCQIFDFAKFNGKLYAALYSKGLYHWNDLERQWIKSDTVRPLVLASTGKSLVAGHNPGGIFWRDDVGKIWGKAAAFAGDGLSLEPDFDQAPIWEMAADSHLVLAGAVDGIFYSHDHGKSWTRTTEGLTTGSPGIAFLLHGDIALAAVLSKNP